MHIYGVFLAVLIAFNIKTTFLIISLFQKRFLNNSAVITGIMFSIIATISISYMMSLLGCFVMKEYLGLLGWIPFYLGLKAMLEGRRKKINLQLMPATKFRDLKIFRYCANDIAVFIPLFVTMDNRTGLITAAITTLIASILLLCSVLIASNRHYIRLSYKYGKPAYIGLKLFTGIYILFSSGTYKAFF